MTRSTRADVRNPVLALPAASRLQQLDPDARGALRAVLLDLRNDARARANECWRRHKAPMAAYWKAVSVYAGHIARTLAAAPPAQPQRRGGEGIVSLDKGSGMHAQETEMSRHILSARTDCPDVADAAIGWDRPLQTYFASVYVNVPGKPGKTRTLICRGDRAGDLPTAAEAIAIVEPHAIIPDDLLATLEADRAATAGHCDTPLQMQMKALLASIGCTPPEGF